MLSKNTILDLHWQRLLGFLIVSIITWPYVNADKEWVKPPPRYSLKCWKVFSINMIMNIFIPNDYFTLKHWSITKSDQNYMRSENPMPCLCPWQKKPFSSGGNIRNKYKLYAKLHKRVLGQLSGKFDISWHFIIIMYKQVNNFDPCSDYYVQSYLNLPEVQKALHTINTTWSACRCILFFAYMRMYF